MNKFMKFAGLAIIATFVSLALPIALVEFYMFITGTADPGLYSTEGYVFTNIIVSIVIWVLLLLGLVDSIYNNEGGE
jgi:hypothetical protein